MSFLQNTTYSVHFPLRLLYFHTEQNVKLLKDHQQKHGHLLQGSSYLFTKKISTRENSTKNMRRCMQRACSNFYIYPIFFSTPSTIIIIMYLISQYTPRPPFFLISTNIIVVTNFSYHYSFAGVLHKIFIQFMAFSLSPPPPLSLSLSFSLLTFRKVMFNETKREMLCSPSTK